MPQLGTELDTILHQAAQLASDYLSSHEDRSIPVVQNLPPEDLRALLNVSLPSLGRPLTELMTDVEAVLRYSVRTGHPRFFNQLFGGSDPAAILGEWITALVNTSMYTYEAAPVATVMELELIQRMNEMVGFPEGEGVFAPGGSTSNLMALLAARHRAYPHVKRKGLAAGDAPVLFLSAEAHYSLQRAAVIGGLGLDAAIEVACDEQGRMRPDALEKAIQSAKSQGKQPFLVAATAGTTVAGAFDPLDRIADVAAAHELWFHVDASLGGTVLFSERHRGLMDGVERADSVTWNPHKMMGVPLACSATLMRERGQLLATNGMNADYLFHGRNDVSYDLGDMTLQCGRRVDALKLWFSWQAHGDKGYEQRVDRLFEMVGSFRKIVDARSGFSLIREPQSTNVCFRYLPPALRSTEGAERLAAEDDITTRVRQRLVDQGRFLINYATLDGAATFRMVLNNEATTEEDMLALLDEIEALSTED